MKLSLTKVNWINNEKYWPYILWGSFLFVSVLSLWSLWGTIPRLNHDNLAEFWLAAFDRLIRAGDWSPSWVKEFYFGYGSPLFIFYPPAFFYLAEIPRLLGASIVVAIKIAAGFSFVLAFWGMYVLVKTIWGKWAGLIAGLVYLTTPYHFALIFIRGAYAENLAYALFPWLLLFTYRIFKNNNGWDRLGLSLIVVLLILTNVPSAIVASILGLLFIICMVGFTGRLPFRGILIGLLGGLGLSAVYWLPVIINYNLIQVDVFSHGQNSYINHFISLAKYWRIDLWNNDNYFQIGLIGILVTATALGYGGVTLIKYVRTKQGNNHVWPIIYLGLLSILVFLTTSESTGLWQNFPGLIIMQFPFRLLGAIAVVVAILSGGLVAQIPKRYFKVIGLIVIVILLQATWLAYPVMPLRPGIYKSDAVYTPIGDVVAQINYPDPLPFATSNNQSIIRHTAEWGYAPKNVSAGKFVDEIWPIEQNFYQMPFAQAMMYQIPIGDVIKTQAKIDNFVDRVMGVEFDVTATQSEKVIYHQIGFPGWQVKVDDKIIDWVAGDNQKITFTVPAGFHQVSIKYTTAPGAQLGGWTSLIFLLALTAWGYFLKKPPN